MKKPWQVINQAIKQGAYKRARRLIQQELKIKPKFHWLLFQLSSTYYEERRYKEALVWSRKALARAPWCPLAFWHHAGALDMLGRTKQAIGLYLKLAEADPNRMAKADCGESVSRARSLVCDSFYRLAGCYEHLSEKKAAIQCLEYYLGRRKKGWRSIYSLREAKYKLTKLKSDSNGPRIKVKGG